MQPITRQEVLPIGEYEQVRPHFRARVIEEKRDRRVTIADDMSVTFENRDTVLLQIQEMLRAEIESPYNVLLVGEDDGRIVGYAAGQALDGRGDGCGCGPGDAVGVRMGTRAV